MIKPKSYPILFTIPLLFICFGSSCAKKKPISADKILVEKSKKKLSLLKDGKTVKTYKIALGSNPKGHKVQEGDGRVPEGIYYIDGRNPESKYHLSLHISYPNKEDRKRAKALGVDPGKDIMIHGLPNGSEWMAHIMYTKKFWTRGCIAVKNDQMDEIWSAVPDGTVIQIIP